MSKDPGHSNSKADSQGSRIRALEAELDNTKAALAECELLIQNIYSASPVVYEYDIGFGERWTRSKQDCPSVTRTARLAFIEEIPKECKHEPSFKIAQAKITPDNTEIKVVHSNCKHCGVELVASWSEKK